MCADLNGKTRSCTRCSWPFTRDTSIIQARLGINSTDTTTSALIDLGSELQSVLLPMVLLSAFQFLVAVALLLYGKWQSRGLINKPDPDIPPDLYNGHTELTWDEKKKDWIEPEKKTGIIMSFIQFMIARESGCTLFYASATAGSAACSSIHSAANALSFFTLRSEATGVQIIKGETLMWVQFGIAMATFIIGTIIQNTAPMSKELAYLEETGRRLPSKEDQKIGVERGYPFWPFRAAYYDSEMRESLRRQGQFQDSPVGEDERRGGQRRRAEYELNPSGRGNYRDNRDDYDDDWDDDYDDASSYYDDDVDEKRRPSRDRRRRPPSSRRDYIAEQRDMPPQYDKYGDFRDALDDPVTYHQITEKEKRGKVQRDEVKNAKWKWNFDIPMGMI